MVHINHMQIIALQNEVPFNLESGRALRQTATTMVITLTQSRGHHYFPMQDPLSHIDNLRVLEAFKKLSDTLKLLVLKQLKEYWIDMAATMDEVITDIMVFASQNKNSVSQLC